MINKGPLAVQVRGKLLGYLPADARLMRYRDSVFVFVPSTGEVYACTEEGLERLEPITSTVESMTQIIDCDTEVPI